MICRNRRNPELVHDGSLLVENVDWLGFVRREDTDEPLPLVDLRIKRFNFFVNSFFRLKSGVSNTQPVRGSKEAREHQEKLRFWYKILSYLAYFFLQTLIFASIFFFQCGPKTLIWVSCSLWVWDPWLKSTLAKYWEGNVGPRRWKQKWKWLGSL